MHPYFSSEVNSSDIPSDNPIFQRTKKAYELAAENVLGRVLEVGCGEGYGIPILLKNSTSYVGIDKNAFLLSKLKKQEWSNVEFQQKCVPPLDGIEDSSFDTIICFQVIEHIEEAAQMVDEIERVLKPGGKLYLTTPNALKSVSRNPWHVREYEATELVSLISRIGPVSLSGIVPNGKALRYYELSNSSTKGIVKLDLLNFSGWMPAPLLYLPYEILNRFHRNRLQRRYPQLVEEIDSSDYLSSGYKSDCLDLFAVATKN